MSDAIRWMSARKFREGMKDGSIGEKDRVGIHVGFNAEVAVVRSPGEDETRQMLFAISSEAVDRDTDTVAIDGWDLKNYRNNPVVLFGHNYWNNEAPVVGNSLSEFIANKKLKSLMEFTPQGMVPLADTLFGLYSNGFMRATSVGFIANDYEFVEDDLDRPWGIDFFEQELIEYSLVPVPSNPEALQEARSKSIDTGPLYDWTEEILEGWKAHKSQSFWLPKSMVRDIRKQADPKQRTSAQVPKGGDMEKLAATLFVQALTPDLAESVAEAIETFSSNTGAIASDGITLEAGSLTLDGTPEQLAPLDGLKGWDGKTFDVDLHFSPSDYQSLLDKAAEAEPETKLVLLPCPACGVDIQVLLVETDEDKAIECECGFKVKHKDGLLIEITEADLEDDADPAWLVSLRAAGAPDVVIDAAKRAHERGAESDDETFELSDDLIELLETSGVDVEATLAKDPDASQDPDGPIDFEGIEVVGEDGARCGLRDFFEQKILPESIDEGVKAAIENVLQP